MKSFSAKFWESFKKQLIPMIMTILIVGLCWFALFDHYTSSNHDDIITQLETTLLDMRFLNRGQQQPQSKVGILGIDEKSIQTFGRWPFSRRYYQQALSNLKALGVQWVGFDAVFSEPEKPKLADAHDYLNGLKKIEDPIALKNQLHQSLEKIKEFETISPGDQSFSEGIAEFSNIVLGFFYFRSKFEVEHGLRAQNPFQGLEHMENSAIEAVILPGERELKSYSNMMKAFGIVANVPHITAASSHHAFFSNEADGDAIIRWATAVKIVDNTLMPSLSLKIAAEAMQRDILVLFDDAGIEAIDLVDREEEKEPIRIPIDPFGRGRILINHRGPALTFPHYSLADAYNNSLVTKKKQSSKDRSYSLERRL